MRKGFLVALILVALATLNYRPAQGQMMGHDMMMGGGRGMQMGQAGMAPISPAKTPLVRTDRQGAVSIKVTYTGRKGDELFFDVRLNTHSVNLDQYRIEKISLLRDDKGNQLEPLRWDKDMGGGHHRSGILVFPAKLPNGKELMAPDAKYMEIVIKGVDDIPARIFKWDLPLAR